MKRRLVLGLLIVLMVLPAASLAAGSAACTFLVDPPLPEGLTLDPALGHITGQPATAAAESVHTVTAANFAGSCACELRVTVMAPPSELSYLYGDDGERVLTPSNPVPAGHRTQRGERLEPPPSPPRTPPSRAHW